MKNIVILVLISFSLVNGENKTIVKYDPGELLEKIFNPNNTILPRQYGLVKFEGQSDGADHQGQYGFVAFNENDQFQNQETGYGLNRPLKFEDGLSPNSQGFVNFQDDNNIDKPQKKRKRRRKPKQRPVYPGYGYPVGAGAGPPYGVGPNPYISQGYRPPRRPKPSLASEAISAVTGALTSIALYDDYQCVPRLLCEAAGGGALGNAGSSGILQSIAGLQPLLTLLSAYNGISTSPLFVFGRAVFLGMTSKGNTGTCRYAYPQCPTDPEQLIHYLNNHNGGFFRFFNAPQLDHQQNLQQFYNQLSIPPNYPNVPQSYGILPQNYPNTPQNYGPVPQNNYPTQNYQPYPNDQPSYGLYSNALNRPYGQNGNYGLYQQNYGASYPYANNNVRYKNSEEKDKRITKRIQNIRTDFVDNNYEYDNDQTKWYFPDDTGIINGVNTGVRVNKTLLFPDESRIIVDFTKNDFKEAKTLKFPNDHKDLIANESNRKAKGFFFPGDQSNRQYIEYYNYPPLTPIVNGNFGWSNHREVNDEEGVETVYVVRGNGDPNNPEVIKIRPGQKI